MTDEHWYKLMSYGKLLGCHQLAERSLFYKGYQFPICARCTGVLSAYLAALIGFFIKPLDIRYCGICCAIMFLDWFIQYIKIKPSTNFRRIITGFIGGYGLMTITLHLFNYVFQKLI